ncbi:MAG: hypothetical protein B7Y89_11275 [Novosphingobium sp. 32-60-15]|uniref:hypothetical protein n=1 Tax=Novosphingobium sp. 32-60-15 TaxID=1970410 RepID=UPI000BCFF781|nr:hypothetical protein [Novosphingobium sp. 32-60-15]OYX62032.1 MAG: hypothetical protein B7Y89_11275 [Novosphingobium sp. 32-60-15]
MAVVTGTNSSETLNGTPQDDTISGLDGADTILGDLGADTIDGGNGNDTLTGAGGSDAFLFSARNFGQDIITDFVIGTDWINLAAIGVSSFAALQPFITQAGSDTVITLGFNGASESIRLQGVTASQLTAGNFVFFTNPVPIVGSRTIVAGSDGGDVLFGSTIGDVFIGLAGTDRVNGDGGTSDELSYQFRTTGTGLTAATGNRTFTVTASSVTDSAGQFSTTFSNIESVTFDTDTSNPTGFATGETTINTSAFTGANGVFVNHGNSTNRLTFTGSAASDRVVVGQGSHVLDGGASAGFDTAMLFLDGTADVTITQAGSVIRSTVGGSVSDVTNFESVLFSLRFNSGASINASTVTASLGFGVAYSANSFSVTGGSGNDRFENHYEDIVTTVGTTTMTGGAGADTYSYAYLGTNLDKDIITDFSIEDRIDFFFVETGPVSFIGSGAFTNVANQIRYLKSGSTTLLQADSNGDGVADATLTISNGAFDLRETSAGSAVLQIIPEITGSNVADTLTGTAIADRIFASGGDDRIIGSTGPDVIDGGTGSDRLEYQFLANGTGLSGVTGSRTFTITASGVTDSAGQINTGFQNIERVSFDTNAFNFGASSGQAVFTGFSTGTTTFNASAFTGASGVNVNNAPYSNNVVFTGSSAADSIAVGPGAHVLDGGAGSDSAQVILSGTTNSTLTQTGTTIRATTGSNITDISNFEQVSVSLQFSGGASINATGVTSALTFSVGYGTSNHSVTGGNGNDRFENHFGGGSTTIGTTTMTGGAGADTYSYTGFGTNFDKDVIADFATEDRIDLSLIGLFNPSAPVRFIGTATFSNIVNQVRYAKSGSTTLLQVDGNGDGVADATLTIANGAFDIRETALGSAVLQIVPEIVGTDSANFLNGTAGDDVIRALGGDDSIIDRGGNDFIDGGAGNDRVTYDYSAATGPVTANFALFTPSSVPTSYNDGLGGTDLLVNVENVRLRGSSGNDSLTGSATIGTLIFGGSGADTLTGGSGDDFIYGDFSFTYVDGPDVINAGEGDDGVAGDLGSGPIKSLALAAMA